MKLMVWDNDLALFYFDEPNTKAVNPVRILTDRNSKLVVFLMSPHTPFAAWLFVLLFCCRRMTLILFFWPACLSLSLTRACAGGYPFLTAAACSPGFLYLVEPVHFHHCFLFCRGQRWGELNLTQLNSVLVSKGLGSFKFTFNIFF